MSRRLVLLGLFLCVTVEGNAGDALWLGSYNGSTIPGHEIMETDLLTAQFNGLQHEGVYHEMLDGLKTQCMRQKGMALVNVVMMPAIGDIKMPSQNASQAKIVSPGLHLGGLADCVLKVK